MNITALVPCRSGSERVPFKNLRPFAGTSLLHIKLEQLFNASAIDNVIVSTDDQAIVDACAAINNDQLSVHHRDPYYSRSETTTDALAAYFADELAFDHLLWTHVTSPFAGSDVYEEATARYKDAIDGDSDSLLGVQRVQEFVWRSDHTPVNYSFEKDGIWPRTQTVEPLYIVNSALFMAPRSVMRDRRNRIGLAPEYFEMDQLQSFDIDWQDDFTIAEIIWKAVN